MTRERWTKVSWDGLTAYPGERSKLYGGPLGIQHFGFLISPQPPGATGTFHHHEAPTEEIYVLLRGRGQLRIEDDVIEMEPLDGVRIPSPLPHGTSNPYDEECWWMVLGAPNDEYIAWDPKAYTPVDTTVAED
jgi:oxalate decarboxylase/phosphoglucose isomerase-like protein (cupin superfamily)